MNASQNQLSEWTGKDRKTVRRLLSHLKPVPGPHGAKLYDSQLALEQIYVGRNGDGDPITTNEASRLLMIAKRKEIDLRVASQSRDLLPVSFLTDFLTEFFVTVRAELRTWPISERARMEFWFKLHEVFIGALRECGFDDVTEIEAAHRAEVGKFKADLAAGHIPDDWRDPLVPEQHGRVWSQELRRYYSKQEIIEKFGDGTYISPVDEVLDEAGVMPVAWENRTEAQKSGLTK